MSDKFHTWLEDRILPDQKAMDNPARHRLREYLDRLETITIMDLGSGTGSSVFHFINVLQKSFTIHLVDYDKKNQDEFSSLMQKKLPEFFISTISENRFILKNNEIEIQVQVEHAEIGEIDEIISKLDKIDLISANALFDLFTVDEFKRTLEKIDHCPIYFTLNYCGSNFSCEKPELQQLSTFFLQKYDEHMQRKQQRGVAMGPTCCQHMLEQIMHHYGVVTTGNSNWDLSPSHILTSHLLNFMENALPDIVNTKEMNEFKKWKVKLLSSSFTWTIKHQDYFAHPLELLL